MNPQSWGGKFGASFADPSPAATKDATAITGAAPVAVPKLGGFGGPGEPLFWFGIIAATAVGCAAYATVQRVAD